MFIDELEKKLDMQCIIRYQGNTPVEDFSRKFEIPLIAGFVIKKDVVLVNYYMNGEIGERRDSRVFIDMFKGRRVGNMWSFYADSNVFPVVSIMKTLYDVPSVVYDGILLFSGAHELHFRFHSSNLEEVSDTVFKIMAENVSISLSYFGPTNGLARLISTHTSKFPLSLLTIKYRSVEPMAEHPYYLEQKAITETGEARSVIYLKKGDSIEAGGKVFRCTELEYDEINELISTISSRDGYYPVCTISKIRRIFGGETVLEIILPNVMIGQMIDRIHKARLKFPDLLLHVVSVEPINPESVVSVS